MLVERLNHPGNTGTSERCNKTDNESKNVSNIIAYDSRYHLNNSKYSRNSNSRFRFHPVLSCRISSLSKSAINALAVGKETCKEYLTSDTLTIGFLNKYIRSFLAFGILLPRFIILFPSISSFSFTIARNVAIPLVLVSIIPVRKNLIHWSSLLYSLTRIRFSI